MTRRQGTQSVRHRMMMLGILKSAEQQCETASAVGKTNAQLGWQLVEGSAQNYRDNSKLSFRGHAHGPGHHVLGHALRRQHVPRMHQHGGALISTMVQESHDSGIVEIFFSYVITDLHSKMARAHTAAEFFARSVNILQRNLAQGFQPAFSASA